MNLPARLRFIRQTTWEYLLLSLAWVALSALHLLTFPESTAFNWRSTVKDIAFFLLAALPARAITPGPTDQKVQDQRYPAFLLSIPAIGGVDPSFAKRLGEHPCTY